MRLKENDLAEAATILIAVGDGVWRTSLRFSLELEGYAVKLCDEHSLLRAIGAGEPQGCLVLDQDVFARMADRRFDAFGVPVVLMVERRNGAGAGPRRGCRGDSGWSKSRCLEACCSTPSRRPIE